MPQPQKQRHEYNKIYYAKHKLYEQAKSKKYYYDNRVSRIKYAQEYRIKNNSHIKRMIICKHCGEPARHQTIKRHYKSWMCRQYQDPGYIY